MAASSAASDDDILSAFSKPKPGEAAPAAALPDEDVLKAYSKPTPAPQPSNDPYPTSDNADVIAAMQRSRLSLDPLRQQFASPTEAPAGYNYGTLVPFGSGPNGQFGPTVPNFLMEGARAFNRQTSAVNTSPPTEDVLTAALPAIAPSVSVLRGASRGLPVPVAAEAPPNRLIAAPTETPLPPAGPAPSAVPAEVPPAAVPPAAPANALVPAAPANRLTAPAESPPIAETPTEGPRGNLLPIRTQAQAEAKADEILRHFAQGGNTTIDTSEIVPGSTPTLAKAIVGGNPGISALERRIAEDSPNAFQPNADKIAAARSGHFSDIAGTKEADDVAAAQVRARYQAEDARVFSPSNMDRADPTSVIKLIDDALAGRQGQRGAIAEALAGVREKLVDANGKMQTDPDLLYGVRQDINDSIGPLAQGTKNDRRAAAHELIDVRNALDPVINDAAPGFSDFIQRFSQDMGPIEGRRYLRSMRLTDANANITLGKLDQAIKTLESQRNLPGLRAGDSVTQEQLDALNTLREDFRTDSKRQLGRALGSPTAQNFGTSRALDLMTHPAVTAATTIAGATAEPILGLGGPMLRYLFSTGDAKGKEMVMEALKRKLLNPSEAASAFEGGAPQRHWTLEPPN